MLVLVVVVVLVVSATGVNTIGKAGNDRQRYSVPEFGKTAATTVEASGTAAVKELNILETLVSHMLLHEICLPPMETAMFEPTATGPG